MKIKQGFMLRKVGTEQVVVAIGRAMDSFNGMIKLNESGVFCWKLLLEGCSREELSGALAKEYGISMEVATTDTAAFLELLGEADCFEEEA